MYYELDDYVKDSYTAKYGSGVERREAILRKSLYKSEKDDLEEIEKKKEKERAKIEAQERFGNVLKIVGAIFVLLLVI